MFAALPHDDGERPFAPMQMMPDQGDTLVLHLRLDKAVFGVITCTLKPGTRGQEAWSVARSRISDWHGASVFALEVAAIESVHGQKAVDAARAVDLGPVCAWSDPCLADWKATVKLPAEARVFAFRPFDPVTVLDPKKDALWLAVTPDAGGVRVDWLSRDEGISGPYGYRLPTMSVFEKVASPGGAARQFARG